MGRIQSSIGLITGVPITDTVDQLVALSARPRDLLVERTAQLSDQQTAISQLMAQLIAIQVTTNQLGNTSLFDEVAATSSDPSLVSVTVTGSPAVGTYQYTPIRLAGQHQLQSTPFAAADQPIGAGTLKLRFGGFVDSGRSLDQLNGGSGVERGQIRITDRSGASAVVDLRTALTIDDVLEAINNQSGIQVTAVAEGDRLKLIDTTGQTVSNLKVEQAGTGTTAADLGLAGIDVAANEASGQDVLALHRNLQLDQLNDGSGVDFGAADDLVITFRDGSNLSIDLTAAGAPQTLGQLLDRLNAADPARLSAAISAGGDTIELTDLTGGTGNFTVASGTGSSAAEDLGIATSVAAATITSRRLQGGLKSVLLASLGGGQGLGQLGQLVLTDRAGQSDTIDLSSAQTLDDVVRLINAAPTADVTARVNDARNGLVLIDNTQGAGNLVVANSGDGTTTADKLRLATNAAVSSVDSGSLDLQVLGRNTLLSSLNNGRGVATGSFTITDTSGGVGAVNLAVLQPQTVGDVMDAINALGIGVVAEINPTGDGIRLRDTAQGAGKLTVQDAGNGTAAADLKIAGTSTTVTINGTPTEVIDGATTLQITISATDTLTDVADKINALDADISASVFNTGSGTAPYRLMLVSQRSGKAGELLVDTSAAGFTFQQLTPAQDALLLVGSLDSPGAGALAASPTNQFDGVLDGAQLTVEGTSTSPVTVTVDSSDSSLTSAIQQFVDQYNKLRDKLDELTFFNESDNTTGILFGSTEALRIQTGLGRLLSDRFLGLGSVQSLEELGISLDGEGKLSFDQQKLESRLAASPDDVKSLFTDSTGGFSARFNTLIESLAGEDNSLLVNRAEALQRRIDSNNERIDEWNQRLERQRQRLLNEFYRMETVISQLRASLTAIASIQPLPPFTLTGSDQ